MELGFLRELKKLILPAANSPLQTNSGVRFQPTLVSRLQPSLLSNCFNLFTGKIPAPLLHNSTRILELRLSNNFHDGSVPQGLGNLPFLEIRLSWFAIDKIRLEVRNSRVHWQPLQGSVEINHIDLSGNYFVGRIPLAFSNFQKLLSMDLFDNSLNGSISREIFLNLLSLSTNLNLSTNLLGGPLPEEIVLQHGFSRVGLGVFE
ncbi:hypothetical protein ACFX2H_042763 [Malus domestica]